VYDSAYDSGSAQEISNQDVDRVNVLVPEPESVLELIAVAQVLAGMYRRNPQTDQI
jgi:hypothetical protein